MNTAAKHAATVLRRSRPSARRMKRNARCVTARSNASSPRRLCSSRDRASIRRITRRSHLPRSLRMAPRKMVRRVQAKAARIPLRHLPEMVARSPVQGPTVRHPHQLRLPRRRRLLLRAKSSGLRARLLRLAGSPRHRPIASDKCRCSKRYSIGCSLRRDRQA
jgi:hypothetical protein